MFYRVDYMLFVLLVGLVSGFLLSKWLSVIPASRLARGFHVVFVTLLVARTLMFACTMLPDYGKLANSLGGLLSDALGVLFGALFGLAARRKDARAFLTDSFVVGALCTGLAFNFASAGIGKAFSFAFMTDFFAQSGYSITFLKLIMIAEVFGGLALLLPWAVVPALIGLTIDMFGAVLTHVHNGDPLDDSTGAIGMLIRLLAVAVLWTLRPREGRPEWTVRRALLRVLGTAVVCLLVAFSGSLAVRRLGPPPSAAAAVTK